MVISAPNDRGFLLSLLVLDRISSSFQAFTGALFSAYVNKTSQAREMTTNLRYSLTRIRLPRLQISSTGCNRCAKPRPEFRNFIPIQFWKFAPYHGAIMPGARKWHMSVAYDLTI